MVHNKTSNTKMTTSVNKNLSLYLKMQLKLHFRSFSTQASKSEDSFKNKRKNALPGGRLPYMTAHSNPLASICRLTE